MLARAPQPAARYPHRAVYGPVCSVGVALCVLLSLSPNSRADFLTTVSKGLGHLDPTTFPVLKVPPRSAFGQVAQMDANHAAALAVAVANKTRKAVPLTSEERAILRPVLADAVDTIGVVFGAELPGISKATTTIIGRIDGLHTVGDIVYVAHARPVTLHTQHLQAMAVGGHFSTNFRIATTSPWEAAPEPAAHEAFVREHLQPHLKRVCGVDISAKHAACRSPSLGVKTKVPGGKTAKRKRCNGSGRSTVISDLPGFSGKFIGGRRCAHESARFRQKQLEGRVADGYGTLWTRSGTWTGHFVWGRPKPGRFLFVESTGSAMFGVVDKKGRWQGAVKLPQPLLGITRYAQFVDGQSSSQAWLAVGEGKFRGQWKAGLPLHGEFVDAQGTAYEGKFCKALPCGKGRLTAKGFSYEGRWKSGRPSGLGSAHWKDSNHSYLGQWRRGQPEGVGKMSVSDGVGQAWAYNGSYKVGKRDGSGTLSFDGCSFRGTWSKGRLAGESTLSCPNFEYTGGLMGSGPHGRGSLNLKSDGGRYRGRFHLGTLMDGLARWPVATKSGLAAMAAGAARNTFAGSTVKRLYYKGKFRGVLPHGDGALYVQVESASGTARLVLRGSFDNRSTLGTSQLVACKERQGAEADEWLPGVCSAAWIVDGSKTSTFPVFP